MSKEYEECFLCKEQLASQTHHIILRSECKPLEEFKKNKVELCLRCHDFLHHDRRGYIKLKEFKMNYQKELQRLFDMEYFTKEEIKEVLKIKDEPLEKLLKILSAKKGMYEREDIIRACMGGKILLRD